MARQGEKPIVFSDFRGGRNGADPPLAIGSNECVEAYNVDFWQSSLGRKRGGSAEMALTSGPDYYTVAGIGTHVPGDSETVSELWVGGANGADNYIHRYTVIGGWESKTPLDGSKLSNAYSHDFATLNGKLFIASDSYVKVLRVWDGTNLRVAGLSQPAAPTAADQGSGTYAATVRYYKVAYTVQSSSITIRRSELSSALTKTPSGSGVSLRVTKPAALSNGETHWELYASDDNLTYHLIATTAVATTTYDDSALPSAYTGDQPPVVGTNIPPVGCRCIATDSNRLLFAPSYAASVSKTSRVTFTPVLGASDIGDDERVPLDHYIDVGESDGDAIVGMAKKPFQGSIYVFKYRNIYKLTPTGNSATPYSVSIVSSKVGAVHNAAISVGEDQSGNECIYFMSFRGPYRIGVNGVEFIGHNVEDLNVGAEEYGGSYCSTLYYPNKWQVWFQTLTPTPTKVRLVYDIRSGGWSQCGFDARFYTMYLEDRTSPSRSMLPYAAINGASAVGRKVRIVACDTGTTDAGTAYQAYVKSGPKTPSGLLTRCTVDEPVLAAKAQAGTVVQVTATADYGLSTSSAIVSLTPKRSETRIMRKAEGLGLGVASAVQYTLGDVAAIDSTWSLDALVVPASSLEPA
jgi:hypothetical protein